MFGRLILFPQRISFRGESIVMVLEFPDNIRSPTNELQVFVVEIRVQIFDPLSMQPQIA